MKWNYSPNGFVPCDDHYIEEIYPMENENGIALKFSSQPSLTIIARSFTISNSEIIRTTYKPWLSPSSISVRAPMAEIPTPYFWKMKFQELGYDIGFRYYMGESKSLESIPYPNYSGYFIQLSDKINSTRMGIGIGSLSIKNHEVSMSFLKNRDDCEDVIWIAFTAILAQIPQIKISCGNLEFTSEEWKQLLKNNEYL